MFVEIINKNKLCLNNVNDTVIVKILYLQLIKGITEVEEVSDVLEGVVEVGEYLINVTMMARHWVQCPGVHHQGG